MNLVAVVVLACCYAIVATGIAFGALAAAARWRKTAREHAAMHGRAMAIATSPSRKPPLAFDFAALTRRRTAFEILGVEWSEGER